MARIERTSNRHVHTRREHHRTSARDRTRLVLPRGDLPSAHRSHFGARVRLALLARRPTSRMRVRDVGQRERPDRARLLRRVHSLRCHTRHRQVSQMARPQSHDMRRDTARVRERASARQDPRCPKESHDHSGRDRFV